MSKCKTVNRGVIFGRMVAICAAWAVVAVPANGQSSAGRAGAEVKVSDYETVDLAVQDTDLAQVLQMLSIQSQKNIITSKSVSATVTANLFDVTFHEALDAILRVNGYRYIEEGNFIYIYTEAEYQEVMAANRKTEPRAFHLDYLAAVDANEFITPLLSEDGRASYRGEVEPGYRPLITRGGEDSYAYAPVLVVNDYPENLETIAALIDELDIPPQQVLVEATILQTAVDESDGFGVDFSVLGSGNLNFLDVFNPLAAVNALLDGSEIDTAGSGDRQVFAADSTVGGTAGSAGLKIGIVTDDVSIFLKVLDEVTDTTVLARPKVMCLNRQRAEVLVGARVGYLSTTATQTTTTQTVEFLDTGIQLVFRPFISRDGMIRMELSPSVSEASLRTVTDANGLLVTIPDELTNELTTNVRIRDGQTLVLGGLYRESTRTTRRQIPFFGDIPLIGAAFRGHEDTIDRDEIIFLITPSIVKDDLLWEIGQEALVYGEAIQIGAREGLLPFSRDKMTANHNQRAVDAQSRGDIDLALWHIKASLHLNQNQAEAVRFRQELVGSRERPYEPSVMERAFRSRMGPSLQSQAKVSPFQFAPMSGENAFVPEAAVDDWPQGVVEAENALEVSAFDEVDQAVDQEIKFNDPVAGTQQPVDDFEPEFYPDNDFNSELIPEAHEQGQTAPDHSFNSEAQAEDFDSDPHFVPPPSIKDESSLLIGDLGYDELIDGFIPPPAIKTEPSRFVRSSDYAQVETQLVPLPAMNAEPSEFIRGAGNTTTGNQDFEFNQPSGEAKVFQPISNMPISIDPIGPISPNARDHVESSHAVSEQFVPGLSHHHVFWWMGWDPERADTRAWEDPFPFVTFDYLPHVVGVPEHPEP